MREWLILILVFVCCATVRADYEITWYSVDGGGGTSSGGSYTLVGTLGQADTGVSSGGEYVLSAGFWPGNFGCVVNLTDLAVFCAQWLGTGPGLTADFDGSLKVDMGDFSEFAYWWLDYCPAGWQLK